MTVTIVAIFQTFPTPPPSLLFRLRAKSITSLAHCDDGDGMLDAAAAAAAAAASAAEAFYAAG